MRKIFLYFSLLLFMQTAFAADSLFVRKPQIPILIDRTDNILVEMRVQAVSYTHLTLPTIYSV